MSNIETQKPVMLTLEEAGTRLGVTRGSLHKYIALKKIRTIKFFGRRLIPETEVERLLEEGTE